MRIILLLIAVGVLAAATDSGQHPDGSKAWEVSLDTDGKRHGSFTAWHLGGKVVAEQAKYDHGRLHGFRNTFDVERRPLAEETWVEGRLVYPRSIRQITAALQKVEAAARKSVAEMERPAHPDAAPVKDLADALVRVRQYRYLCGVPHEHLVVDHGHTGLAQDAANLLAKLGQLTHSPKKNPGTPEDVFKRAQQGCGSSNLSMGNSLVGSVDSYMNDSDKSNIDRIGHRRWLLSMPMAGIGFGISGKFSATFVFDKGFKAIPDFDHLTYPPAGYMPKEYFTADRAFHLSLNPKHYAPGKDSTVAIQPLDARLKPTGEPFELDYDGYNGSGFGYLDNARIFRAKGLVVKPGASYEVVVGNLKPKGDQSAEIKYIVTFF